MEWLKSSLLGLDSNIVSFLIRERKIVMKNRDMALAAEIPIVIPPFVYYEVKWGLSVIKATRQLRLLDDFCSKCTILPVTQDVFEEAVNIQVGLKTNGWNIDDTDIYIASYCKVNNVTLVTNNTKHFGNIPGLELADWTQDV
jgi:predicted nucleic acid-binding protein